MGMVCDLQVIDEDDFKEMKKLKGQKLLEIRKEHMGEDLLLIFEKDTLKITSQDSENYGTNIFYDYEKSSPLITKEKRR